ncbi:polyglutamine-repeat protein pqn-41 isoform X2 [Drosophila nasuta]|uniref:polyglutamine-repeat protein pqn-41 isoform X2 n=1 Tax=Drosophila nasuta TaxID=42062 RepID=UPI00295F4CC9|nr:polyglutamine-repeat protein pqn-41 isoform X2 [Drosophila nasuta]
MLPANNAGVASQAQIKRDLSITMKPGNSTTTTTTMAGQEEQQQRYLPIASMPSKPCNITISSYNHASNNNNHNSNNSNLNKGKLLQKQLNATPVIQLMATSTSTSPSISTSAATTNGNKSIAANSLLSILTLKATAINNNNNSCSNNSNINPNTQQQQSSVLRPAPGQQQQNGGKGVAATAAAAATSLTLLTTSTHKSAATPQISLISSNPLKSHPPVILSKAAVEKIRFKFGQVQAQANSGALILNKPLKSNNNSNTINNNNNNNNSNSSAKPTTESVQTTPKPTVASATIAMPTPMPLPLATPMPTPLTTSMPLNPTASAVLPELKISTLPATVNFNGAKFLKMQGDTLAVVMPPLVAATDTSATAISSNSNTSSCQTAISPNKLQRSKSLAGNMVAAAAVQAANTQSNATERRHSVAIMSKEVDVVEQPIAIETITIDDDDDEEEEQKLPQQQQQQEQQQQQQLLLTTPSTQTSRKSSTASRSSIASIASSHTTGSTSSLEMIILPPATVTPAAKAEQPEKRPQEQQLAKISIVKAETLPVSKEDFEKSLHCPEQVEQNSPPCAVKKTAPSSTSTVASSSSSSSSSITTTGSITLTPINRLLNQEQPQADDVPFDKKSDYKRNMQLTFGMLTWQDQQPSTLDSSTMRFTLNRYNLLQVAERCKPRQPPSNYFDRALFDRTTKRPTTSSHPLLYLCSRCNCHGPASDFLAPRFCSICCVKRAFKRRLPSAPGNGSESKAARLSNGHAPQQQQQQQQQQQHNQQQLKQQQQQQRERERDRKRERKTMPAKRPFRWTEYLKAKGTGPAAPIHLFLNPFPITPNCFERGMKLEAIDPENCSLFCVCTIVEVRGYRLKLNFDGYASMYDFWVNADSMDIFPPGWCERTSHILQAPKGYCPDRFTWYRYLVKTNAKAAPKALFTHLNGPTQTRINGFQVGMHLEAEDLNDTGKICVATVADILDERIRVHFDGWDDCYDFWVHVNSPYIHPCSWHEGRQQLIVPPDYQNIVFNWADYIAEVGGVAAPVELFSPRDPMEFQPRMKLEVVDQRNPSLIRPATVITRKGYRVQLHLDCWPTEYYFWLEDDSPDLHPIGWCEATLHELETPPGFLQRPSAMPCDVDGCRGFGNAKRFNLNVHAFRDCCPYAPENWRQWRAKTVKPPRVLPEHIKQANSTNKPKESSPLLLSRLSTNTKPNAAEKIKTKQEKSQLRHSVDSADFKPKMKSEDQKPVMKKEPLTVKRETAPATSLTLSIAKPIVADYGPQMQRNYQLWQKNSEFDMAQVKTNPLYWTTWDVYEFVERALKSATIAQQLFDEEIDGRALLMMGRNDLATYFKLKVGPTVKLFSLIVNLRIAVACKFKTMRCGLNIQRARFPLPNNKATKPELDNHSASSPNSMKQDEEEELTDEDDVILDADDFLNVKPRHSMNITHTRDGDVTMLPSRVASIS